MPIYEWDSALETGNELVDAQHKNLFDLVNEMLEADISGNGGPRVDQALDRLVLYAATHFGAEEQLMLDVDYPQEKTYEHVAEHRRLTEETRQLVLDYRQGKVPSIVPVAEFLCEWLAHHIEDEDREVIDYIRQRRKSAAETL